MRMTTLVLMALAASATGAFAETAAPAGAPVAEMAEARVIDEPAPGPEFTISGSLTFASRYVSDGVEYSTGGVIQPYIELGYAGFYAGAWATNASEELLGADSEVDYYLGYRGEVGAFFYDLGYGYYTYPGASDLNSGEWLVNLGAGVAETLFITTSFAYANEFDTLDSTLLVDYYTPVEGLSLSGSYGYNDSWNYWSIGGGYAVSETFSFDVSWNDTTIEELDGVLLVEFTTEFNLLR